MGFGKLDLGCSDCKKNCCRLLPIQITLEDYNRLKELNPNFEKSVHIFDNFHIFIKPPCPYVTDKGCSIYEHRTDTCKAFPIMLKREDNWVNFAISYACINTKQVISELESNPQLKHELLDPIILHFIKVNSEYLDYVFKNGVFESEMQIEKQIIPFLFQYTDKYMQESDYSILVSIPKRVYIQLLRKYVNGELINLKDIY